jgi:hypothetical protein
MYIYTHTHAGFYVRLYDLYVEICVTVLHEKNIGLFFLTVMSVRFPYNEVISWLSKGKIKLKASNSYTDLDGS